MVQLNAWLFGRKPNCEAHCRALCLWWLLGSRHGSSDICFPRYVRNVPLPWCFNFLALRQHKGLSGQASSFPFCKQQIINAGSPGLFLAGLKVQQEGCLQEWWAEVGLCLPSSNMLNGYFFVLQTASWGHVGKGHKQTKKKDAISTKTVSSVAGSIWGEARLQRHSLVFSRCLPTSWPNSTELEESMTKSIFWQNLVPWHERLTHGLHQTGKKHETDAKLWIPGMVPFWMMALISFNWTPTCAIESRRCLEFTWSSCSFTDSVSLFE